MTTPTRGDYDITDVANFDDLLEALEELNQSDDPAGVLADLFMNGHKGVSGYVTFGNNKVSKNTGIFNMNSATDCPNAGTSEDNQSETGVCQARWKDCYAHVSENVYPNALKKRRLQEYLFDNIDAHTFAEGLRRVKSRKRTDFDHLRVSESGDFRHRGDIIKWDRIAELVDYAINIFTYSASHRLEWDEATHFTVNQSNALADYGDREFNAVADVSDIPDDAIACPFEIAKANDVETDNRPKCGGACDHCIVSGDENPRDVYVLLH
jgi:hypothetical protein